MKKIISVLIVFSLILSCFAPRALAIKVSTPIVYIGGQPDTIYKDRNNKDGGTYNTGDLSEEELNGITSGLRSALTKGLAGNWTDYCNGFYEAALPYYEPLKLDEFGDPINKTGYDCLKEEVVDKGITGRYGMYDYTFVYDWRLDPLSNSDELNTFINQILSATKKSKVSVVAEGIGAGTLLAYLYQYGSSKISEIVFVDAALGGSEVIGAMFADDMNMDASQLAIFVAEARRNIALLQVVKQNVDPENWENLVSVKAVRATYGKIYENVIPRIMREVFGTMPGYWSMVGDDYFDEALDTVFADYQYAYDYQAVIRMITTYHDNVYKNTKSILNQAKNKGVNLYFIANYGFHMVPIGAASDTQSDINTSVTSQTLGAITAAYNKTLGDAYITKAKANGEDMYISPDGVIDASTAFAKDHTWFVKNLENGDKPACVDDLITAIFAFSGYTTVFDLEAYPQYLYCSDDQKDLSAIDETGSSGYVEEQKEDASVTTFTFTGFLGFIRDFIQQIVDLVTSLIRFGQTTDFEQIGNDTTTQPAAANT